MTSIYYTVEPTNYGDNRALFISDNEDESTEICNKINEKAKDMVRVVKHEYDSSTIFSDILRGLQFHDR